MICKSQGQNNMFMYHSIFFVQHYDTHLSMYFYPRILQCHCGNILQTVWISEEKFLCGLCTDIYTYTNSRPP